MKQVSVVVPAYNPGASLAECLRSLLANDYPAFEVILVDDGSSDDSLATACRGLHSDARLRVLSVEHGGPARARNHGIRAARGEYVFFTDADVLAPTDWISGICRQFELRDVAAVGGGVVPMAVTNAYQAAEQFRYHRLVGDKPRLIAALPTCNLAVKRTALEAVGLFDDHFKLPASEDFDLCFRLNDLGYRIWYAPERTVRHQHPSTLEPILRRGFIQGSEAARLALKRKGNKNVWLPGGYFHCLENLGAVYTWTLIDLPKIPREYRWIVACYDLMFAIGWRRVEKP